MNLRNGIALLVFSSTLSACSAMEESMVSAVFQNYVAAQEALAADNAEGAKKALAQLGTEAESEIGEVARAAAHEEELAAIRAKFKELSGKIETLELPKGYLVAYCPMADNGKGATWVQKDGDIKNPYFGSEMESCGEVKKRVE